MMTSASPGRGGCDGDGAGRAQRGTGSSNKDRKICSTASGKGATAAIEARKRWGSETRNFRTEYRERWRRKLRATPEQTRHRQPSPGATCLRIASMTWAL